jgi:DNA helicase-2/ATP-dependent DNA helicase PcrA
VIAALAHLIEGLLPRDNPEQKLVEALGLQHILVEAPAGCGKTEVLATRARALIRAGVVKPPRQLLALTFSNRARENLQARLRRVLGPRYWQAVAVMNFHGFARRLILSHGEVEDLDPATHLPQRGWLKQARIDVGIDWAIAERVDRNLRAAKRAGASDAEVISHLERLGDADALRYELHLRAEARLDYDDLLRYADRILAHPEVAHLYACRFVAVLVDEVQDLTLQQLRMATAICPNALTAVGDLAQGIYAFAGAEPEDVLAEVRALRPARVRLRLSYRSAPRILDAVNVVARLQGDADLECADPGAWETPGEVRMLTAEHYSEEAEILTTALSRVLDDEQPMSIGVITRRGSRADELRSALEGRGVDFEDWRDSTHNRKVVHLLRRKLKAALDSASDPEDQLTALGSYCREDCPPEDVELLDDLADALATAATALSGGMALDDWVRRCREAPPRDQPVAPGIHLLTAHSGKGQQFDWVVALGLEEGILPDFREVRKASSEALAEELRVLHVMVSRAKSRLTLTRVRKKYNSGRWWTEEPSRWWEPFGTVVTHTD